MTSLRHLRAFVATAEQGSTAGAARALHISQPSVSVAVRELEAALGSPLFHRAPPKGVEITPFGRRKLVEARRLLAGTRAFLGGRGATTDGATGAVTFGYFATLGPSHVPALLGAARHRLPDVEVDLVEGDLEGLSRMLERGRVELALTYDVGLAARVAKETVASYAPEAVLPAGHPLAERETVSLKDLAAEPFILVDLPHSREFLLAPFWLHGLEPRLEYRTGSLEMVRGMVANGLGVSLLITSPALDRAYDGKRLVRRPLAETVPRQRMILAYPDADGLTAPAAAFADVVRGYFAAAAR